MSQLHKRSRSPKRHLFSNCEEHTVPCRLILLPRYYGMLCTYNKLTLKLNFGHHFLSNTPLIFTHTGTHTPAHLHPGNFLVSALQVLCGLKGHPTYLFVLLADHI